MKQYDTKRLAEAGLTTAFFYNWGPLGDVMQDGAVDYRRLVDGVSTGWEEANALLAEECLAYLTAEPCRRASVDRGFA